MITDGDIKKLKVVFTTKDDLGQVKDDLGRVKIVVDNLVTEVTSLRRDYHEMNEKMATKDDIRQVLTGMDHMIGELQEIRLEQTTHFQEHEDIKERINKIEQIPAIAHELKKP